ncbi:unnamed protein product [Ambrosiozyma monospora]|uniref:Unnamed protein product n=1 Tax=Ambrosiozyma monospora TaxID=43982 RepID=A0ACB5T5Z0_AMBMO|nr:unnamed protein product [Ambrosiozyma monospora]
MAHSQSLSIPDTSQRSNSNSSTNNGGPISTTTPNNDNNSNGSNSSGHGAFLSSAADLEYAILGNIIQTHDFMSPEQQQFMSPSLSASNSDDVEYLNYQPLMLQSQGTNGSMVGTNRTPQQQQLTQQQLIQQQLQQQQASQIQNTAVSNSGNATVTTSAAGSAIHPNIPSTQQQQAPALFNNGYQHPTPTQLQIQQQQASTLHATQQQLQHQQQQQQQAQAQNHQQRTGKSGVTGGKISDIYSAAPRCDATTNQYFIGTMMTIDGTKTFTFPEVVKLISLFKKQNPLEFKSRNRRSAISFSVGVLNDQTDDLCLISSSSNANAITSDPSPTSRPNSIKSSVSPQQPQHALPHQQQQQSQQKPKPDPMRISNLMKHNAKITPCGLKYEEPSQIYKHIQTPFSYVKPYHDLNVYLKKRFDKNHLISVSRSIAEYRPSFIAAMVPLKEEDMIFAEQCFQRTLLEYDNYISLSGTPTLVWRRTSQIAYVGDEFCILTGWSKDALLGKSTFAVEVMDDKSCVEYFRLFSKIAFGDFRGATMTECTLLTPERESIRTSCIWTLKRDVFGIPMMIIANFLPILT